MSGLEVVGSIASVIQLAGAVYAISKTLYEVGDALSNAPSDIKDLARDLETFSEELHLLSSLLDGKHRYSDRVYSLTAKILGDCAAICVKIDRLLKKLRSGSEKQDQEPITVPSTSITPIDDTKELWWRAYGELKITSPRAGLEIAKAWNKVSRSMLVGSSAAKLAETNVGLALIHLDWIYNHFCVRSSNTGKLYTAMPRLERISRGTENTLKYKFGALAWVCLSSAIQVASLCTGRKHS